MKIGIITIHRISNFGSVLQAYALQEYIERTFGCRVEIIDYLYPNRKHLATVADNLSFKVKLRHKIGSIVKYLIGVKKQEESQKLLFKKFLKDYIHLSPSLYISEEAIKKNPPLYDLYITGSDQVWNYKSVGVDGSYFLQFAPAGSRKISFGASFALSTIPNDFANRIKKWLSQYSYIGLREKTGIDIINKLNLPDNIKIQANCDPVFLLNKEDYHRLNKEPQETINESFILVYKLRYAYDPNPAFSLVLDEVIAKLGCQVVIIGNNMERINVKANLTYIKVAGVKEFLWLFEHAKFVVTSSFHGTAFSLINRKPFVSIIPKGEGGDSRIKDLLDNIDLGYRAIKADQTDFKLYYEELSDHDAYNIRLFVNKSKDFLKESIK